MNYQRYGEGSGMQFFYIDYMNDGKKERNIGFLRVENDGISVGLRGVPMQCGDCCKVYVVNIYNEEILLGEVPIKGGYGMEKFHWTNGACLEECMRVEIPLYGTRKGVCVMRASLPQRSRKTEPKVRTVTDTEVCATQKSKESELEEIQEDKWQQLLTLYPEVHICPEAQSILIRPKDVVVLTGKYHDLASNSFVLHSYYNYRQLLLFRFPLDGADAKSPLYYLGVPGVYYEREQRIAQLFGFEGFENGEARMQQDADKKVYKGCFGYYMKRVEI